MAGIGIKSIVRTRGHGGVYRALYARVANNPRSGRNCGWPGHTESIGRSRKAVDFRWHWYWVC